MTESIEHAKSLYPDFPLCIGYLSQGSTMNFVTSLDNDYTSLGYIQEKFPDIINSFKMGEWYIDHGHTMSIGEVCYIKTYSLSHDSTLEVPLSELELFVNICGIQQKKCKVCRETKEKMMRCAGCDKKDIPIFYCSQKCQKKDWKKHKKHCFCFETCGMCGKKSDSLKKCSGCESISYCDRQCQKKDWKTHKPHCRSEDKDL